MSSGTGDATESAARDESPLRYVHTPEMPELLERLQVSLWATTYQAGKLVVLRPRAGRISMLPRSFPQAMGLALSGPRIAVGTRTQVWFLENEPQFGSAIAVAQSSDACFLPRRAHVTGNIRVHEIAWDGARGADERPQELWMVNTLFSCLCTLDDRHSFVPRWRPPFIQDLAGDDRCHLNGVAMRNGRPEFVTVLAETNEPAGWREQKLSGGCVLDVASGEAVVRGLCMPHSPRWHQGKLWLLNSGRGELLCADVASGATQVVAQFPGYPRGLAFVDQVGFVGLSQVRERGTFGGLPVTENDQPLPCGIWAVDLRSGKILGRVEFQGAVAEIFDVHVLRAAVHPFVVGLEKETIEQTFVVPSVSAQPPASFSSITSTTPLADSHAPGTVVECRQLGRCEPYTDEKFAADVYYVRYASAADDGSIQAAKLYLPVGEAPAGGWPVSLWCHGLGDPATQLHRWPLVNRNWPRTRGKWAGRWANMGLATLTPWMPGDGPSEPLGSYSPYSLQRNAQALADAFLALAQLAGHAGEIEDAAWRASASDAPCCGSFRLDLERIVLRTDCVASSLLIYFAAHFLDRPYVSGVRVLVADDFQPGIVHNQSFLGPIIDKLPARDAATVRCVWMRVLWALFVQQGYPLGEMMTDDACELFAAPEDTPVGRLSRIYAARLVPAQASSLADRVVACLERSGRQTHCGSDLNRWMYAPRMLRWIETESLPGMLQHDFYRTYLADADPFFAENITPFCPKVPLLVVGRAGRIQGHVKGLPDFEERFQKMTQPKVQTLRSWGWHVNVFRGAANQGTSFGGGPARQWVLEQLDRLI